MAQGVRVSSQLIGVTLLARLLPPQSYGVMALAMVAVNLANVFRDMGSSAAIIQTNHLNEGLVGTVHVANVVLGLIIGTTVALSAPILAVVFREPALTGVLLSLAIVFPITAMSLVHQALLERESRFSPVVTAEIAASVTGLTVAAISAYAGAGVYSLVLQQVTASVLGTLFIVARSSTKPSWTWNRDAFASLTSFSGNLALFNLIAYFTRNTDSVVIGRVLGSAALGVYSVAYRIMMLPLQNLTFVSFRALFPIMSRKGGDIASIAELYLKALALIAFLSAPLMAGLFATRELFIDVMLGSRWHAAARILAWLAPVGAIQSLVSATGTVSLATGRTDILLRLGLLGAGLHATCYLVGSNWGVEGVAAGYLVASVINAGPAFYFTGQLVGISIGTVIRRTGVSLLVAMLMAVVIRLATGPVAHAVADARAQLFILVALAIFIYAVGSLCLLQSQLDSFRNLIGSWQPTRRVAKLE